MGKTCCLAVSISLLYLFVSAKMFVLFAKVCLQNSLDITWISLLAACSLCFEVAVGFDYTGYGHKRVVRGTKTGPRDSRQRGSEINSWSISSKFRRIFYPPPKGKLISNASACEQALVLCGEAQAYLCPRESWRRPLVASNICVVESHVSWHQW